MSYPLQIIHSTLIGDLDVKNEAVVRSFIEDRFAEYLIDVPLPRIVSTATPYVSTYNGVTDPNAIDVMSDVELAVIHSEARIMEGKWGDVPTRTTRSPMGGIRSGIVNYSAEHLINNSGVVSTALEEE